MIWTERERDQKTERHRVRDTTRTERRRVRSTGRQRDGKSEREKER